MIFVEVSALTVGEMPNENGYYVLGTEELNILFGLKEPLFEVKIKDEQKSVCVPIKKGWLNDVTNESILKSRNLSVFKHK